MTCFMQFQIFIIKNGVPSLVHDEKLRPCESSAGLKQNFKYIVELLICQWSVSSSIFPSLDEVPQKKTPWAEQEVRDARGRSQRFHGAFTGGFSAGFFNTVGSKEGMCVNSE